MIKARLVLGIAILMCANALAQFPPEFRQYQANFTSTPPTIDGADTGDWAAAEGAADDWRLLREATAPVDAFNNRFQMLWDNDALYLRVDSDNTLWGALFDGNMDFGADNLNLYIDPNRDGEANGGSQAGGPNRSPDGYQIAFNNFDGTTECGADGMPLTADDCSIEVDDNLGNPLQLGSTFGTYAEAHVDSIFGNQAEWAGMRSTHIAQTNGASGGIIEMKIPWTDFDAPALDADGLETGLNVGGEAPSDSDVWFFNAAVITTDPLNFLPAWNWHTDPNDTEFFSSRPHGEITFAGGGTGNPTGDFDADGDYDCDDINALTTATAAGTNDAAFDLNGDGSVDIGDIDAWRAEAGAANGLPGPYTAADITLDGVSDVGDFNAWNTSKFTTNSNWCEGDVNGDGVVDVGDFNIWNTVKFTSSDGAAAVPEPAAFSLLALAGLALLGFRRR
jgi:hypothetical protein